MAEEAKVLGFLCLFEVNCGHSAVESIRTDIHLDKLHCAIILCHSLEFFCCDLKIHVLNLHCILGPSFTDLTASYAGFEFEWLEDDSMSFFFSHNKILIVLLYVAPHGFSRVKFKHNFACRLSNSILHHMYLLNILPRRINLRINLLLSPSFGKVVSISNIPPTWIYGILLDECFTCKAKEREESSNHNYNVNSVLLLWISEEGH